MLQVHRPGGRVEAAKRQKSASWLDDRFEVVLARHAAGPFAKHGCTIAIGPEHRRVHDHQRAAPAQHATRSCERTGRIRRIVQRPVEHDHVKLAVGKRERIEIGADRDNRSRKVPHDAQRIQVVCQNVDRDDAVAQE